MKTTKRKVLKYSVLFQPTEEGGFIASVPALPGCATQGETFEEAQEMIKDAISGYLAVLKDNKQEIPEEKEDLMITKVTIPHGFI